jgi:hypothetical protein
MRDQSCDGARIFCLENARSAEAKERRPSARRPSDQLRTRSGSITLGDLALSRDLPVVRIDMLNAIAWLAEAFGKKGYNLECAGDVARCSRAGSVIYYLTDLELVHSLSAWLAREPRWVYWSGDAGGDASGQRDCRVADQRDELLPPHAGHASLGLTQIAYIMCTGRAWGRQPAMLAGFGLPG